MSKIPAFFTVSVLTAAIALPCVVFAQKAGMNGNAAETPDSSIFTNGVNGNGAITNGPASRRRLRTGMNLEARTMRSRSISSDSSGRFTGPSPSDHAASHANDANTSTTSSSAPHDGDSNF